MYDSCLGSYAIVILFCSRLHSGSFFSIVGGPCLPLRFSSLLLSYDWIFPVPGRVLLFLEVSLPLLLSGGWIFQMRYSGALLPLSLPGRFCSPVLPLMSLLTRLREVPRSAALPLQYKSFASPLSCQCFCFFWLADS